MTAEDTLMAVAPSEAPRARAVTSSRADSFNFTSRRRHGGRDTATKDTPTFGRDVEKSQPQQGIKGWLDFGRRLSLISALKVVLLLAATALVLWRMMFWSVKEPLRIPKREWPVLDYQHLNFSLPVTLSPSTQVFHVAKEFGPATMGGLGVMLTALSVAQTAASLHRISIILPYYSFLRISPHQHRIEPFSKLHIPVRSPKGKVKSVGCQVSLLKWDYASMAEFLDPTLALHDIKDKRSIDVYLIGPGNSSPFHVAFQAKDAGDVYSAYKPLKQEWKDLWFAKATAELVSSLNSAQTRPTVDVVHLHGATNAMVAYFLRQQSDGVRPAIVYTLHDSLDEVEYSNLVVNAAVFLPPSTIPLANLSAYIHRAQLFPSAVGIDLAEMVTFVSRSIAADIVEGRFTFALQDLVMPSIAVKASKGAFIGVTNGLDFTEQAKNPFVSSLLVSKSLAFPRVGADLFAMDHLDQPHPDISFVRTKSRAKEHLIEVLPSHFSAADLARPLLLFIGRFQHNKGCEFFEPILEFLSSSPSYSARLVVLGARNNYPIKSLRSLQARFPNHFTLIDDTTTLQEQYGPLIRMAADFSFVPSFSEAFGLVAAEGLLFGQEVISTGVGGLVEFLRPQVSGQEKDGTGNARLFQLFDGVGVGEGSGTPGGDLSLRADHARPGTEALQPAIRRCVKVVGEAVRAWQERVRWSRQEQELFVRRLVQDALNLKWDRERGPVEEMARVYQQAVDLVHQGDR